jgi:methylglutaconyl-CoA hydratase
MIEEPHVRTETEGAVGRIILDRPRVKNAFSDQTIAQVDQALVSSIENPDLRVLVITGAGSTFSAGADLGWMKACVDWSPEQNRSDAMKLASMLTRIEESPKPVVARIQGPCFGGATGIVAACDIAIASENSLFAFSEARLGIAPALISPYLLRKLGRRVCREYFLTGKRFYAPEAAAIGLVNQTVPEDQLDAAVEKTVNHLLACGPEAQIAIKELIDRVPDLPREEQATYTAAVIARLRSGEEGQEGMGAFFDKRRASWVTKWK